MVTAVQKGYTIKDYKKLKEGDPHQLINGDFIMREASPTYGHQGIVGDIFTQIRMHLLTDYIGEVRVSPIDVYLDDSNILQPDIVFLAKERLNIAEKDGIHGAPDLVMEVLSPSTSYYDTSVKKDIYEKHGVKELWIIDPEDQSVNGFENLDGAFCEFFTGKDVFFSKVLNLEISLELK